MFRLVIGELDLVLGHLDEAKTFEEVLMDIWTIKDLARRREELERFGETLLEARKRYDSVKSYEDGLFGGGLPGGGSYLMDRSVEDATRSGWHTVARVEAGDEPATEVVARTLRPRNAAMSVE